MKRLTPKQKAVVLKAARYMAAPGGCPFSCSALKIMGADTSLVDYYQEFYQMSTEAKAYGIQQDLSVEEYGRYMEGSAKDELNALRIMMLVTFAEVG